MKPNSRTIVRSVHDRREDEPWGVKGSFFSAIRVAYTPGGDVDPRLRVSTEANTLTGSEGGYAVPPGPDFDRMQETLNDDPILSRIDRVPVDNSRAVTLIRTDEGNSRADSSRHGGIKMDRVDEMSQYAYTFSKTRQVRFDPKAIGTIVPATNELLLGAPQFYSTMAAVAGNEIAFTLARRIVNDIGGPNFLGLIASSAKITVSKDASQTISNTSTYIRRNAADMVARCSRLSRAVFLLHPELIAEAIAADALSPVDADAPFGRLATRPVFPCEVLPAVGTVGDMLLVDLSDYTLVTTSVRTAMSIHVRFLYDESLFRFTVYADGSPNTSGPITPFTGSLTKSPIVALQARS